MLWQELRLVGFQECSILSTVVREDTRPTAPTIEWHVLFSEDGGKQNFSLHKLAAAQIGRMQQLVSRSVAVLPLGCKHN